MTKPDKLMDLLPPDSCNSAWALAAWREEFDTLPIDAADIIANPRTRAAFAAACHWPVEHITARVIGRHIVKVMGGTVMKIPSLGRAQRWSLKP